MSDKTAAKFTVFLGLTGLLDAVYLTVKHYTGGIVPCSLTNGCETVLTSQFAVFGGLPIALWGIFYYLALIILAALFLQLGSRRLLGLAFGLVTAGVFTYAVLIYLQAQILAAWCAYCLLSAVMTTIIFGCLLISRPAEV